MKVEKITPQKAANWLKHNTRNRKVRGRVVERYAGAMKRGEWKLTHEGIAFNCDGTLVDGQHRLMACIQANTPFEAYVFRGVDADAFTVINSGACRTAGDALSMIGKKHAMSVAAAVRGVYALTDPRGYPVARRDNMTTTQIIDLLAKYQGLEACVEHIWSSRVDDIIAPSVAGALCFIVSRKHADLAADFFTKLGSGEGITRQDPEYWLRKRMLDMRRTKSKPSADFQAALLVRAWNAKKTKTTIKALRWGNTEAFPEIKI